MEQTLPVHTGMTDLMHAARAEARRVMEENKGDFVAEHRVILQRLVSADLIRDDEAATLLRLYQVGFEAGEGKGEPAAAFFTSRDIYDELAASTTTSPVALVVAAAAVGSFEISPGTDGAPVVTAYARSYGQALAGIGAGIGSLLGGPAGAVLGGEIGGLIGGIVDDKKGKGK